MSFNPAHNLPPESQHSHHCAYCGEAVPPDALSSASFLVNGDVVHDSCLADYADARLFEIRGLKEKIAQMTERIL